MFFFAIGGGGGGGIENGIDVMENFRSNIGAVSVNGDDGGVETEVFLLKTGVPGK